MVFGLCKTKQHVFFVVVMFLCCFVACVEKFFDCVFGCFLSTPMFIWISLVFSNLDLVLMFFDWFVVIALLCLFVVALCFVAFLF